MSPEVLKAVMTEWNRSHDHQKNGLMKLFLENNGDFSAQHDWLLFLADAFGISEYDLPPMEPGYHEH